MEIFESAVRRPFMTILHCYFDESGKMADHPVVSFSGVCAFQSKLSAFESEWKALLRQYEIPSLHMKDALRLSKKVGSKLLRNQSASERVELLLPFTDCINRHLEFGLLHAVEVEGFHALSPNTKHQLGQVNNAYYLGFMRTTRELLKYVNGDDRISVICDDDRETALGCHAHYRALCADAEFKKRMISLTFANDEYFPAIQAADMAAYLARLEAKYRFYGVKYGFSALMQSLTTSRGVGQMVWHSFFVDKTKCEDTSKKIDKKRGK
jgi:hypothetical protein